LIVLSAVAVFWTLLLVRIVGLRAFSKMTAFDLVATIAAGSRVENGRFIEAAMHASRVSKSNILEKLRAADVRSLNEVRAVVLETTGDLSVLTKDGMDDQLLEGVRRA
jgi:uncharacterized membrane protein YcaP (DUF421 family)